MQEHITAKLKQSCEISTSNASKTDHFVLIHMISAKKLAKRKYHSVISVMHCVEICQESFLDKVTVCSAALLLVYCLECKNMLNIQSIRVFK